MSRGAQPQHRSLVENPDRSSGEVGIQLNGEQETSLSADMLGGADRIAEFLYGDRRHRRKIYHLVAKSRLPVFRIGSRLFARKSKLLSWISEQESKKHD